jgi:hypothetical protein
MQQQDQKQPQSQNCYSVVDDSLPVTRDHWVVSIARKPDSGNPEHAMLTLEGVNANGQIILRRYDLFMDRDSKEEKALINIKQQVVAPRAARYIFLNRFIKGEALYAHTWTITRAQANALHAEIERDQANPPQYQVSGDRSLIAKSYKKEGHSCFSWARAKLLNLNDNRIRGDLYPKMTDFIAAQTSRYIKGAEQSKGYCLVM